MGTKRKGSTGLAVRANSRRPKKAKMVSGDKAKVKKLAELKKVTKQLDKLIGIDKPPKISAKEKKIDSLFDQKRKIKEQLGIE